MIRYEADGWYYMSTVARSLNHGQYLVQDEDGSTEIVNEEAIVMCTNAYDGLAAGRPVSAMGLWCIP